MILWDFEEIIISVGNNKGNWLIQFPYNLFNSPIVVLYFFSVVTGLFKAAVQSMLMADFSIFM